MKTQSPKAFQMPSPVVLSSSATVKSGSTGGPDYTQLSYPFRKPLLIHEVRFDISCVATGLGPDIAGLGGNPQLGAIIGVKMQLGRNWLMRDYVPVWLLGTSMGQFEEGNIDNTLSTPVAFSHYRWLLPEPLYIEAGETLRTTLSRSEPWLTSIPNTTSQDMLVQVSYAGCVVPPSTPRPRIINVPYAAAFVTPWGVTYDQSNENDLFNPFNKGLRIQRMTGRLLSSTNSAGTLLSDALAFTPTAVNGCEEVQIFDSWGGKLAPSLMGPSDLWDPSRKAWTYDTLMPEKGQYDVRAFNIAASRQLHVAIIGTREEYL